jgi:hypothetical protein
LIFTELLRYPQPNAREIARKVSAKLRRTEEARIYHWHQRMGKFPPRRGDFDQKE